MSDKELQLEDTVSADRKERIIYVGPGKTRKISSITSRQNFDNEKFTRNKNKGGDEDEKEEVKESAVQPCQSDMINQDKKKKSNSSQIEFVTGTEKASSASTATGNSQMHGVKKISEALVKKALTKVKADKNVGTEEIPFDGPYIKSTDTVVDKSGARHTPISRVRHLARQAMNKQVKEELKGDQHKIDKNKNGKLDKEDFKLLRKEEIKQVDEKLDMNKTEMGDVIKDFQQSDAPQFQGKSKEKRREMAIAAKLQADKTNEETTMSKTYAQFIEQLLEYTPGPGGVTRVQGRSYGAQYHDPEGDDDADDKAPAAKAADAPKRGRGRPAGSKSGANQKVTTGKSYGGIATHSLHLPNSK